MRADGPCGGVRASLVLVPTTMRRCSAVALVTGEDACRWIVRWREGELGTRAYDHAAVKGDRAGATDAGRGRGVHSWH
jgi:hypothetical protein